MCFHRIPGVSLESTRIAYLCDGRASGPWQLAPSSQDGPGLARPSAAQVEAEGSPSYLQSVGTKRGGTSVHE